VLAVPDGPYLGQALPEGLAAFESQITLLQQAGYSVRRVRALEEIADIKRRHMRMIAAELAQVHRQWFSKYESLYRPRTAALIREGQSVSGDELAMGRNSRLAVRTEIERLMSENEIDLWICPPATGTAPKGLEWTGDAAMNLPWTHAGMPAITVPAGHAANGLPLGFQCVAAFGNDDRLLAWAQSLARTVRGS
jgi:Asp-tRNA(Asn)/Glu-tRNA(Gln) amidotransferase A subunit family amidase